MRRYSNAAKSVCVLSVFLLLFGYVAVDVCQAQELCKKLIATGNPEYPPFLWRDAQDENHLAGANADLMQAISKEIGVPIEVKYVGPWARVQEEARLGRVDLIAGAFYTPPRLDYMDYFYPAFRETRTAIWTKKIANSFSGNGVIYEEKMALLSSITVLVKILIDMQRSRSRSLPCRASNKHW